jgi:hypothetical protein
MRIKLIGLFASGLLLFFPGCNTYKVEMNDPYRRYNVINPKWTIKTDEPNPDGLIQYNCVYIHKNQQQNLYEVFRFWPTGQAMFKYLTSDELKDLDIHMNTFYYSYGDYYKLEGNNFTRESFNSMYHTLAKGYIDGDGNLIIIESGLARRRLTKWAEPGKYIKTKTNLRTLEPDW